MEEDKYELRRKSDETVNVIGQALRKEAEMDDRTQVDERTNKITSLPYKRHNYTIHSYFRLLYGLHGAEIVNRFFVGKNVTNYYKFWFPFTVLKCGVLFSAVRQFVKQ